jgi:Domain of unknown function (DUF1338)
VKHSDMLTSLLHPVLGSAKTQQVRQTVAINATFKEVAGDLVSRDLLAQALALVLFQQLLDRVPTGRAYVDDRSSQGQKVVFDHGAVRTVAWPCGALPRGEAAISRVLRPLGYAMAAVYPLPRLGMTGRAWRHRDRPEDLPQFFVSEFHPERFSSTVQAVVDRVVGASTDPLHPDDVAALEQLDRDGQLPLAQAMALLPQLVACFDRQHAEPSWTDYQTLLAESPEMAWISTEGNAFNHATDRVTDLATLAQAQRDVGRPIKDRIEVSASGRVQQTAFRADPVRRRFVGDAGWVERDVPGSFYEFIQRAPLPGSFGQTMRLDLAFDAGNATGIFGMTAAAQPA